jgi:urease accessory protein UreE
MPATGYLLPTPLSNGEELATRLSESSVLLEGKLIETTGPGHAMEISANQLHLSEMAVFA